MSNRKFVISDIHGCLSSFQALLKQIDLQKDDELYLLGDYIDRGPDSRGVLDLIILLRQTGHTVFCLKGNHEQMMLDGRNSMRHRDHWLYNGGNTTLASFDAAHIRIIPPSYFEMIEEMPLYLEVDHYLLVHAGFDFQSDPLSNTKAMLWIRKWYPVLDKDWLGDRIIIHGHTPIARFLIEQRAANLDVFPVLNIDSGCYMKADPRRGALCAFELTSRQLYFQENIDRMS